MIVNQVCIHFKSPSHLMETKNLYPFKTMIILNIIRVRQGNFETNNHVLP